MAIHLTKICSDGPLGFCAILWSIFAPTAPQEPKYKIKRCPPIFLLLFNYNILFKQYNRAVTHISHCEPTVILLVPSKLPSSPTNITITNCHLSPTTPHRHLTSIFTSPYRHPYLTSPPPSLFPPPSPLYTFQPLLNFPRHTSSHLARCLALSSSFCARSLAFASHHTRPTPQPRIVLLRRLYQSSMPDNPSRQRRRNLPAPSFRILGWRIRREHMSLRRHRRCTLKTIVQRPRGGTWVDAHVWLTDPRSTALCSRQWWRWRTPQIRAGLTAGFCLPTL